MVHMLMAYDERFNLTILEHLVNPLALEGLIHIIPVPPGIKEEFVTSSIQELNIY